MGLWPASQQPCTLSVVSNGSRAKKCTRHCACSSQRWLATINAGSALASPAGLSESNASAAAGFAGTLVALAARRRRPHVARQQSVLPPVTSSPAEERRQITELVAKWRANDAEAWASLAVTVAFYIFGVGVLHVSGGHWASIIFLGLTLVRTFIVFHDAAHSSYFRSASRNRWLARILQFVVSYSYEEWNRVHNSHHAHFGDNTVKDTSLTVYFSEEELSQLSWHRRLLHRIIRDPIAFFPLAGLFVFFINRPLHHGPFRIAVPLLVWRLLGWQTLVPYMLASWLGGSLGVACFHLQHCCNTPYRVEDDASRTHLDAAIVGSTRIPVCWPLSLFSYGIQYHHIHHYDVRVPGYRLARCDAQGDAKSMWLRTNTLDGLRAFKSLFHTQFRGSRKAVDSDGTPPEFCSFWPYSALGLQDA
eukprot:TRINITY_DN17364_c0_g2_i1.p1 TRINITY_DN17364_c0_g2~~TRINITY_DN17364_c0_g2_i1.p1  ORF type:complete len:433 (+),score=53.38 TRINITY_DN17364_c0_g2_i1:44-1300(+)